MSARLANAYSGSEYVFRDPSNKDLDNPEWRIWFDGKIQPHSWNSKGAAEIHLATLKRIRAQKSE